MPGLHDTAYPRFKKRIHRKELEQIYTPTREEIILARNEARGETAVVCYLILLKTLQRLGYFVRLKQVPTKIIYHIAGHLGYETLPDLSYYDGSKTRVSHIARIRSYLNITAFGEESIAIIESAIAEACQVKEDLADIINVAIEELVHHRHELPAFSKLRRLAYRGRAQANNLIYQKIATSLSCKDRALLNRLFKVEKDRFQSPWQIVKSESKKLTLKNFRQRIEFFQWIDRYSTGTSVLDSIADVKIKQFSAEGKSLKAREMARLKAAKRYTLAVSLISVQKAAALDDLGEMLVRQVNNIHKKARSALATQIEQSQDRTDNLVDTLYQILMAYQDNEDGAGRDIAIGAIIGDRKDSMIKDCEDHALYAGKNYFPLLWRYHVPHRRPMLDVICAIPLVATTQDDNLIQAKDASFPDNDYMRIERGQPIITRVKKENRSQGVDRFEAAIAQRLEPVTILDILNSTQQWLAWDKCFGLLTGFDSKLEDPTKHYIVTTFCYGCNLGPIQTARSIKDISRYQIAWINQRHVTEEKLNQAIVKTINSYDLFDLPKIWGSGKSASVDGKLWDVYEENLFSEYHIRYGGYGGIGYYHVSDQYIALFSHFIPCGVHEAIYILDGLLKNESNIQPDTVHGDTHAQSATVFGLSYLLGIKLMPRIRNWKRLTLFKPDKELIFRHIEALFSGRIDWSLIEKHLPDMLRVALSIKMGRISASSILRKLGAYSRKNKLYQAFRELGRVVRTAFLLEYLDDKELREIIQAATCKSETFNKFAKWLLFGGEGIISENNRDEQRKIIKYNHFVANCLSLYNVASLTRIINDMISEGHPVTQEMVASLSPYMTAHVNRFGDYHMDFDDRVPELIHKVHLPVFVE